MVSQTPHNAQLLAFPHQQIKGQTAFDRRELGRIMDVYGRMVAAGIWRDYALDMQRDVAVFSAYRRSSERPQYRIEKRPSLRQKQGQWSLWGEQGQIIKRGHELTGILAPLERKLVKAI